MIRVGRLSISRLAAAVCILLAVTAAAQAAAPAADVPQWPRFRGPNGEGHAAVDPAAIPVQWTEKDYLWKVDLPGGGHSSPVVWGDRLFVTSGLDDSGRRILLCLKTSDGSTLWKREFDSKTTSQNSLNSYATPTPAVDAERVYLCWATTEKHTFLAVDHNGKDVWRRELGPFVSQHGQGTSPAVFEDSVVLANDQDGKSFLLCVDARTGTTRWQNDRLSGRAAYSTPCLLRPDGRPAQWVFTSALHGVTGVDAATGKIEWEQGDAFPKRVVGSPAVGAGLVIGTCGEGSSGMHVIAVRPPASPGGKPEVAWKITKAAPYVPTPLIAGDLVFLWSDTGTVSCVRAATGEEVWRERVGANFYGSPVLVGDRQYAISIKGEVFVLKAGDKYELLAKNPLGEKSHATPAVAGGRMYLRTLSHLYAIGQ